jgi:hypothetical protein
VIAEELRKRAYNRKNEFATEFPLPAVDAMMSEIIAENKANTLIGGAVAARRVALTSGSVEFQFQISDQAVAGSGIPLGTIFISMLGDRTTYIYPNASTRISSASDSMQRLLNDIVLVTLEELERRFAHTQKLLAAPRQRIAEDIPRIDTEALASLKSIPRPGSHVSWSEDNWAWRQVNILNRPPEEVRKEWQQRLSPERPALKQPDRSFRHAIDPKRKGGREAKG